MAWRRLLPRTAPTRRRPRPRPRMARPPSPSRARMRRGIPAPTPAPAPDGPLAVTVESTDAAGNTATDTRTLTVDRGTTVAIGGAEGGDDTLNAAEAAGGRVGRG